MADSVESYNEELSERDNKEIIGKRTQKIGVSRLDLNDSKK